MFMPLAQGGKQCGQFKCHECVVTVKLGEGQWRCLPGLQLPVVQREQSLVASVRRLFQGRTLDFLNSPAPQHPGALPGT